MIKPSKRMLLLAQGMSEDVFKAYVLANGMGGRRSTGQPREATGTGAFVQLTSVPCLSVVVTNTSGVDWQIRRGGTVGTTLITIPDGFGKEFDVKLNAGELFAKGASGTLQYECLGDEL